MRAEAQAHVDQINAATALLRPNAQDAREHEDRDTKAKLAHNSHLGANLPVE